MPVDLVVLAVAAVLAVVALVAAVVALRAVREARLLREATVGQDADAGGSGTSVARTAARQPQSQRGSDDEVALRPEPEVRVVEGRVIVTPTKEQVVAAQLTRPSTRLMIVMAGVAHALRPESRDRITGMVKRDYRQRRRARQRAANRAARSTPGSATQMDGWMSS